MKLDSPLFDRIRAAKDERVKERVAESPACDHPGCAEPGGFRAPKGRLHEGQYWNFCFDHVRAYNQTYNYFADMPDEAVAAWQKDAQTGHRPTWTMGVNSWGRSGARRPSGEARQWSDWRRSDPFGLFGEADDMGSEPPPERRAIRNVERRSLTELGLDATATAADIKARFKTLVKRLHPDANGGDRGTEDKLRAVIQAYNYLKQAGFC
jgi:curved DNA-binding protein CbpA